MQSTGLIISILIGLGTGIIAGIITGMLVTKYYRLKDRMIGWHDRKEVICKDFYRFYNMIMGYFDLLDHGDVEANEVIKTLRLEIAKSHLILFTAGEFGLMNPELGEYNGQLVLRLVGLVHREDVKEQEMRDQARKLMKESIEEIMEWTCIKNDYPRRGK